MSVLGSIARMFSTQGGYDALDPRNRRRSIVRRIHHEDKNLRDRRRETLAANTQDAVKNFELTAWAVRKHLDYVTRFSFQANTGKQKFDDELEQFVKEWGSRYRFDVANRHSLRRFIRLAEARRTIDGDVGVLKVTAKRGSIRRGKLQALESDLIRTPEKTKGDSWINGVLLDEFGRAMRYGISKRADSGYEDVRTVDERSMYLHACFDSLHRFDQVRGVSPLAAGLNRARDLYEGFDYAMAKIKIAQLFGLKITREYDSSEGVGTHTDEDGDGLYDVDFGRGPFKLDLDPGEDASFIESETPATETVDFFKFMCHLTLKSLDIPYSFFDESFTNFFGSRGGLMQYLRSARSKQEDCQEMLDDLTRWRIGIAVADGEISLPRGVKFQDIRWEWVPDGVPWWDPSKEVVGHLRAISGGLDNPQRICRETGTDFRTNIDRIAEAKEYAEQRGVDLFLGAPDESDDSGTVEVLED